MYVCLCMPITDREARDAIAAGARTTGQVLRACGSGPPCGGCTPTIRELLWEARAGERRPDDVVPIDRYGEAR